MSLFNELNKKDKIQSITIVGVCTDICVVTNALLLKSYFPEIPIIVDENCCAGTSKKNHNAAINTMRCSQIKII